MQLFISHLASWLRTRRFSEPTFRPSGATNHWKNTVFRDLPTFSRICIFFLLIFSLLTLLTSAFQLSILSEVSLLNFLRPLCTLCSLWDSQNLCGKPWVFPNNLWSSPTSCATRVKLVFYPCVPVILSMSWNRLEVVTIEFVSCVWACLGAFMTNQLDREATFLRTRSIEKSQHAGAWPWNLWK